MFETIINNVIETLVCQNIELTLADREKIYVSLVDWLTNKARKISRSNQLIVDFYPKLRSLANNMTIRIGGVFIVISATGDDQVTLNLLNRGSNWFDSTEEEIAELVFRSVFDMSQQIIV